jgi:hypothetical protein
LEWMNRLSWVRENKGEYFIAWLIWIWKCWRVIEIRGCTYTFLARL